MEWAFWGRWWGREDWQEECQSRQGFHHHPHHHHHHHLNQQRPSKRMLYLSRFLQSRLCPRLRWSLWQWRWWWKYGRSMLQRRKRNDEDCYFISWKKRSSLQCRWKMATIFPGNENSEATPGTTDPISPIGSLLSRWKIFHNFFLNIFPFFLIIISYLFGIGLIFFPGERLFLNFALVEVNPWSEWFLLCRLP